MLFNGVKYIYSCIALNSVLNIRIFRMVYHHDECLTPTALLLFKMALGKNFLRNLWKVRIRPKKYLCFR